VRKSTGRTPVKPRLSEDDPEQPTQRTERGTLDSYFCIIADI
jgi:hypothetical protein